MGPHGDNPRWWISHSVTVTHKSTNTECYQVKAAIHNGTLFWGPWMTLQDGQFPMATLSVIKSVQQYTMVHYLKFMGYNPRWWISHRVTHKSTNTEWYQVRAAIHHGSLFWVPLGKGDNPRWQIFHSNTECYQVRAAIHNCTLFWDPWMTIQDGRFPMAILCGIKSGQQYTMVHYFGSMGDNSRWQISHSITHRLEWSTNSLINIFDVDKIKMRFRFIYLLAFHNFYRCMYIVLFLCTFLSFILICIVHVSHYQDFPAGSHAHLWRRSVW